MDLKEMVLDGVYWIGTARESVDSGCWRLLFAPFLVFFSPYL